MWSDLLCRLRSLLRRESVEQELNEELRFHIERQAEKHMKSGLTRKDADRRARLDFGREQQMKEECREARGVSQIDITIQDLRYTAKSLARSPAFTIVVVLTLGVGIAANAAIFAQVNAVILKTLPVRHPKELKQLEWTSSNNNSFASRVGGVNTGRRNAAGAIREAFSYAAYASLRDQSKSFASLLCYRDSLGVNVMVADHSERAFAQPVSGNYFETLGVSALIGRTFTPSEESTAVAVVSHGFWERVLNSDPAALGVTITIDGTPFVVIGVTGKGFFGIDPLNPADIMIPLKMVTAVGLRDTLLTDSRDWSAWRVVGRLRPEVSEDVARAESEVLVRQTFPNEVAYSDGHIQTLYRDLVGRIQNLPGVVAVSMSNQPLLTGSIRTRTCVPGLAAAASANVDTKLVSPHFFETWGIQLMSGRDFLPADAQAPGRAIVVNEAFARRFYKGKNPIDQTLGLCPDETGVRIVGIVSDVRTINMRVSGNPTMYIFEPTMNSPTIAIRTEAGPSALVPTLRRLMKELDPTLPMTNFSTEGEVRDSVMFQERALSDLMTGFAAIALFLSCLGIYGLLSYLVSQRTSEIGIRMALGARPGQVLQMILRESLFPAGLGLVLGLASALELTGFVENMLFGIPRNDPATMLIVALVLLLAVGVASAIPARRATLVDPLTALRND